MKKFTYILGILSVLAFAAGCTTPKLYVTTKERSDINVSGNQGVIYGKVPPAHTVEAKTRQICTLDLEIPTRDEVKKAIKKESPKQKELKDAQGQPADNTK